MAVLAFVKAFSCHLLSAILKWVDVTNMITPIRLRQVARTPAVAKQAKEQILIARSPRGRRRHRRCIDILADVI